jgi:hypothetical protein
MILGPANGLIMVKQLENFNQDNKFNQKQKLYKTNRNLKKKTNK